MGKRTEDTLLRSRNFAALLAPSKPIHFHGRGNDRRHVWLFHDLLIGEGSAAQRASHGTDNDGEV